MKKEKNNLISRIFKDLFNPYIIVVLTLICLILATAVYTITPKLTGQVMTEIYNQLVNKISIDGIMDFTNIERMLIILILSYIVYSVLTQIKNVLIIHLSQAYIANLREKIHNKILNLPIKYFNENSNGEILSILTNDIGNLNTALDSVIRDLSTEILNIIGACIMMYLISPLLILIDIIIIIISAIIILTLIKISKKNFIEKQNQIAKMNNSVEESYSFRNTLSIFNNSNIIKEKFDLENKKLKNISIKSTFTASIAGTILKFMENVSISIIAIISAILNLSGKIEIGYIYTIISYTSTLTNPLSRIGEAIERLMDIFSATKRIYSFLDEKEEKCLKEKKKCEFQKELLADSIFFSYSKGKNVIKNVNAIIPKGKKIAIVGKTGSGKTTFAKLLMNIYNVNNGKICMDGININEFYNEEYINKFSIINQNIDLFTDTVIENIKYGNENITEEEILNIAKELKINDIFESLPNGYNTLITEDNNNISDSIKQLIIFMQCIISDSPILIFDEATNMLDKEVEDRIEAAMKYIRKEKTLIVIAHKLETIKDADMIYVIENGKIVEYGTHDELISKNSVYASMYLI